MTSRRALVLVCYLVATYLAADWHYARAWDTRLNLAWVQVIAAPHDPRTWNELALSLMEQRRFPEAQQALDAEAACITDPQVPPWDRADVAQAVLDNRLLLARLARR